METFQTSESFTVVLKVTLDISLLVLSLFIRSTSFYVINVNIISRVDINFM